MNEACLNASWLREDLSHREAQEFTKAVLNHMRGRLSDYQEQYDGELFNLEATPAESTVYRFAKYDAKNFPGIITAGKEGETPYYTNSSRQLYGRYFHCAGYSGRAANALYLRHGVPHLPR